MGDRIMKNKKIKVVITHATRWSYFYWFLYGFYELEKQGKIKLKFSLNFENWLSSNRFTKKIGTTLKLLHEDSYNLNGYVLYPDNTKKYFCIDSADSPFLFKDEDLKTVNCYFKMQCPKNLEQNYFALTDEIHIPWLDHKHKNEVYKYEVAGQEGERAICESFKENCYKIRPLMIGPRRLGNGISYNALKKGYENYISARQIQKEKKLMCYFGNSMGPKPEENIKFPDYDHESNIMGYYKDKISHPNEKRAIIADILNELGEDYDGRIIRNGYFGSGQKKNENLYVSLEDFCSFVAKFQYNFNVSGYRLSIPNRFIESFMVGTGIITDKLSVKWYLPFDDVEVKETVSMGYKKIDDIDWSLVKKDILNLQDGKAKEIISCFEKKWAPIKVAQYILKEIEKS